MRVAVCISTFHRPEGLEQVLASLAALDLPSPPPEITVVVVNNDPEDGRPAEICDRMGDDPRLRVVCLSEPQRGLSPARNRALDRALPDHDFIAYLDDDSVATRGWLSNLLEVQQRTGAAAVTGPVAADFESPPPAWIESGGFFARRSHPTGRPMRHAFTNNVLLDAAFVRRTGLRFEHRLRLTGGEDTHFFRRLRLLGGAIAWANDAVVIDRVPAERATSRWLIRRQERAGMTAAWIERDLKGAFVAWPLLTMRALGWTVLGAGLYAAGLLAGRATRVRARCWLAWGRGLGLGLAGRSRPEYLEER